MDAVEPRSARLRLPIALGLIAAVAFAVLAWRAFDRSVVYYRTPTEVVAAPAGHVKLSGTVVPGSIDATGGAGALAFAVTDGTTTVPVRYDGAAPATLREDGEVVADGSLGADGIFHAGSLLTKCPSKFTDGEGGATHPAGDGAP